MLNLPLILLYTKSIILRYNPVFNMGFQFEFHDMVGRITKMICGVFLS